ncbi:MAG: D-tyrosyl-tRNA(Tyr) deacylase [Desulfuromonadales bacterium]|nr:D-tyrosyl-tRNA(Tyr) deacylase [Desulfuromonadales bacterium]
MRAVLQRVASAAVTVDEQTVGEIGPGLLVLLGVAAGDTVADAEYLVEKTAGLRIFEDATGKMNHSVAEVGGAVLVVSQFTLLADCRQGRRPSFTAAAPPDQAKALYEHFLARLRAVGLPVASGTFQAEMAVQLVNQGPVTILLDSRKGE